MDNKKNIAIIPARWGSKGIPKKNLSILNGKPLLAYSIEAAIRSDCFDVICVISDSEEIINFALSYGVETIQEPEYLARDDTKMIDVITHVLNFYEQRNQVVETVTLLQPTSPLRTGKDIKNAVETYFENEKYRSLVSFYEAKDHPYKSFLLLDNNDIKPTFWDEYTSIPRQLLPKVIQQNGAIYINRAEDLLRQKSFFTKPVYPFMMDEISSIDIDVETDLLLAEFYISHLTNNSKTLTNQFVTDYDYSSFVFITGGAFQWKSLLSIKIAERYAFSAILSTDFFRNILRIQKPSKEILCSTSKLTKEVFNKQRGEISELLYDTLQFYAERQEKLVIEGVHFSKEFLDFAIKHWVKCLCLENLLSWERKVDLKKITTPITRVIDPQSGIESYVVHTDNTNIRDITYIHKEEKYKEIHDILSSDADSLDITKIVYGDIDIGFQKICAFLDKHFLENADRMVTETLKKKI